MKHLDATAVEQLRVWLAEAGIVLDGRISSLMLRHVDWLLETNRDLNLTAVTEGLSALRLHVVDSLLALPEVEDAPEGLLLDMGTGGGFPGLELASASGREALLVDSVQKKAKALHAFLLHESLEARISVSGERTETIAERTPGVAAVVTARAVAELPVLVELAAPLLRMGGRLVALKGRLADGEYERGIRSGTLCGLAPLTVRNVTLPGAGEARAIVVFEKTSSPSVSLPRRPGMATKRPLA